MTLFPLVLVGSVIKVNLSRLPLVFCSFMSYVQAASLVLLIPFWLFRLRLIIRRKEKVVVTFLYRSASE